jgi:hypothetical protein
MGVIEVLATGAVFMFSYPGVARHFVWQEGLLSAAAIVAGEGVVYSWIQPVIGLLKGFYKYFSF